MGQKQYFEILTTDHDGMRPSGMFLFQEPAPAAHVLRFRHHVHSTQLHIYVDAEWRPMAMQFRQIDPEALEARNENASSSPSDRETFYRFAAFMIAFAQNGCDQPDTEDSMALTFEAPDIPTVERRFSSALHALCEVG